MGPGDSPAKAMILSLALLVALVIVVAILFMMIKEPTGFYREVEMWIEANL